MNALLALLLLGVVRAMEEVAVEVVTHRRAARAVLVGLQKVHSQSSQEMSNSSVNFLLLLCYVRVPSPG